MPTTLGTANGARLLTPVGAVSNRTAYRRSWKQRLP